MRKVVFAAVGCSMLLLSGASLAQSVETLSDDSIAAYDIRGVSVRTRLLPNRQAPAGLLPSSGQYFDDQETGSRFWNIFGFSVRFVCMEQGGAAYEIESNVDVRNVRGEDFRSKLVAKYGTPTHEKKYRSGGADYFVLGWSPQPATIDPESAVFTHGLKASFGIYNGYTSSAKLKIVSFEGTKRLERCRADRERARSEKAAKNLTF